MPRYFFHTADGSRDRDTEGTELPDHNAARKMAIMFAGSVLNDEPDILWDGQTFRIEVTDETGGLLFIVATSATDASAA